MLYALRSTPALTKGDTPPSRVLVARWGANENTQGAKVIVNETTARILPVVNRALGRPAVVLDFEHNTVEGTPEWKKTNEPRPIAARNGTPKIVPGEGIYLEGLEWTPEGIASYRSGHHPDLSPALKTNDRGEVVFLHSAATCRHGAIGDLMLFTSGLSDAQLQTFSATLSTLPSAMNERQILLKILGLPDTATDAQISAGVATFTASLTALAGFNNSLLTLSATVKTQGDTITALTASLEATEREAITAAAVRDGKLIPLSAKELPLPQFKKLVAELEAGRVPLEKRTVEGIKTFTATPSVSTAEDEVRANLGITKEKWDAAR